MLFKRRLNDAKLAKKTIERSSTKRRDFIAFDELQVSSQINQVLFPPDSLAQVIDESKRMDKERKSSLGKKSKSDL